MVAQICEVPPIALLPNFIVQRKVLRPFRVQTGGSIMVNRAGNSYNVATSARVLTVQSVFNRPDLILYLLGLIDFKIFHNVITVIDIIYKCDKKTQNKWTE